MFYYEVIPADRSYGANKSLVYASDLELKIGQVVNIEIRSKKIKGIIYKTSEKPNFSTKNISLVYEGLVLKTSSLYFFEKLNNYYPGSLAATASLFLPKFKTWSLNNIKKTQNKSSAKNNIHQIPTKSQQLIIESILKSKEQTHIIHGDTGTGKSLIYFEIIKEMNKKNMSSILLTPEINLTPQLSEQYIDSFNNVFVIHSRLSPKQRLEVWKSIYSTKEPVIIIGPRSALFMPVPDLGAVIIDEFHDQSYKQDQTPKYSAIKSAGLLASIFNAKLIMGSATPPIEDYFYAKFKGSKIYRLTEKPVDNIIARQLVIVPLNSPDEKTNYPLLSKSLIKEIASTLNKNQQTLIFLNKRGSARTVSCENCGHIEECLRCNIAYVYHHDKNHLLCHTCGSKKSAPVNCTKCSSSSLIYKTPGTKSIELSLKSIFPNAKIARYDKDNTKAESFFSNYSAIRQGEIDILIGTQTLSKGHDLPNLSLVGILSAESGLQFPDFSSTERNYQLLHQVAGRVGRNHLKSKVVLQTYDDKNLYQDLAEQKNDNWLNFYAKELEVRKEFNYPPYVYVLKVEASEPSENSAIDSLDKITKKIRKSGLNVEVVGPGPALIETKNSKHYWQIIIKSKNRSNLIKIINLLPSNVTYDLDPINLL